jgi:hypothetical protein
VVGAQPNLQPCSYAAANRVSVCGEWAGVSAWQGCQCPPPVQLASSCARHSLIRTLFSLLCCICKAHGLCQHCMPHTFDSFHTFHSVALWLLHFPFVGFWNPSSARPRHQRGSFRQLNPCPTQATYPVSFHCIVLLAHHTHNFDRAIPRYSHSSRTIIGPIPTLASPELLCRPLARQISDGSQTV